MIQRKICAISYCEIQLESIYIVQTDNMKIYVYILPSRFLSPFVSSKLPLIGIMLQMSI